MSVLGIWPQGFLKEGFINHVFLFCFMDIPGEGPVKACVDHVSVILIVKISLKYQNISVCVNGF